MPTRFVLLAALLALPAAGQDPVLLSPKEYQQLLDQLDAAKKKESAKPLPPAACHVRVKVDPKPDRPTAALKVRYTFRTTAPKQLVLLGLGRAFLVGAAGADGKPPLLEQTPDGWAALVETVGEQTVTLDAEAAVTPRGGKGELGFDIGLPRAAITTLALDSWPGLAKVGVTTRTPEPTGPPRTVRSTDPVARYAPKGDTGHPLGPVESLEVAWDAPAAPRTPAAAAASVEADITVRVDAAQVETTAKLRLRDGPAEWVFVLPPGFEPTVTRATDMIGPAAEITRPADPKQPLWKVRLPDPGSEWVLTAISRTPRADGRTSVGPFAAVGVARQSGTIRLYAPVGVRLSDFQPGPTVRRQDAPAGGDDPPAALFRYPALPDPPAPLVSFAVAKSAGLVQAQPAYRLTLTPGGWRLRADVLVTPIRRTVGAVELELPAGWEETVVRPFELVDEVQTAPGPNGNRLLTVRLSAERKEAFTLVVESRFPLAESATKATLPLLRFPSAVEREARLTAGVADGYEVRGTAAERATTGAGPTVELKPAAAGPAAQVTAAADGGFASVDLNWSVYQPPLTADMTADLTLTDRQALVTETVRVTSADPIARPIRLRGPATAAGFRARPEAVPVGPGEWTVTPPAGAKEVSVVLSYAVPLPPRTTDGSPAKALIPLVWPDAGRATAEARVWAADAGGRRPVRFDGPWREVPPKPADDRDALPWLTLAGTAAGSPLPLEIALADPSDPASGGPVVERAAVQAWAADDGSVQVRARFLLKRWASGIDIDLIAAGPPTVFADRQRLDAVTPLSGDSESRVYRIALPDAKPGRPPLTLDIRYHLPPRPGGLELVPPRLRGAAYRTPVWWQVGLPANVIGLLPRGLPAEVRWRWREPAFAPAAAGTAADLDRWFQDGTELPDAADPFDPPPAGEVSVAFRQPVPTAVPVGRVPRGAWLVGWSGLAVAVGVWLSRLRPGKLGLAVGLVGVLAAGLTAVWPQPAGQAAAAVQPGLAVAVILILGQLAARQWHARREARRTGFVRGPVMRSDSGRAVASGTGSNRPVVPSSAG